MSLLQLGQYKYGGVLTAVLQVFKLAGQIHSASVSYLTTKMVPCFVHCRLVLLLPNPFFIETEIQSYK